MSIHVSKYIFNGPKAISANIPYLILYNKKGALPRFNYLFNQWSKKKWLKKASYFHILPGIICLLSGLLQIIFYYNNKSTNKLIFFIYLLSSTICALVSFILAFNQYGYLNFIIPFNLITAILLIYYNFKSIYLFNNNLMHKNYFISSYSVISSTSVFGRLTFLLFTPIMIWLTPKSILKYSQSKKLLGYKEYESLYALIGLLPYFIIQKELCKFIKIESFYN